MVRWQSVYAVDCKPTTGRLNSYPDLQICPGGGMVDTLVLEASAERRESSSLSWGTINGSVAESGLLHRS